MPSCFATPQTATCARSAMFSLRILAQAGESILHKWHGRTCSSAHACGIGVHLANSEGERAEDSEDGLMHSAGQERQLGKLPQEWGVQLILQQQVSSESSPLCISRSSLSFVNL